MGRGDRRSIRWKKDRQKRKRARDKRKAEARGASKR
jgi:hypothetical protein